MDIHQKRIVLTGAASGIGRALLELLSALPAKITAVDIHQQRLEKALSALESASAELIPFYADLSKPQFIDNLFKFAIQKMGGVDLFIANAGFPYYEKQQTADWQHIQEIFHINTLSPIYSFQKMLQINHGQNFKVVFNASAMALMAMPGYALYSATKAALHRFAEAARLELEDPHQLMLVYPIATRTRFFEVANANTPIPWPAQSPQQVAKAILRGIQKDKLSISPSWIFSLILFLDRFQPFIRRAYQWYYRRVLQKGQKE